MSDIVKKREYKDYNEYTTHQIEKTADPERRARLQQKSSFDSVDKGKLNKIHMKLED